MLCHVSFFRADAQDRRKAPKLNYTRAHDHAHGHAHRSRTRTRTEACIPSKENTQAHRHSVHCTFLWYPQLFFGAASLVPPAQYRQHSVTNVVLQPPSGSHRRSCLRRLPTQHRGHGQRPGNPLGVAIYVLSQALQGHNTSCQLEQFESIHNLSCRLYTTPCMPQVRKLLCPTVHCMLS